MASGMDVLPRTLDLLGHIDQESESSESGDSLTSPDDSRDSADEEPPSTSQLKLTDRFQSGHKKEAEKFK